MDSSLFNTWWFSFYKNCKMMILCRQSTSHQPGTVGRGQTVDPHLNQTLIKSMDVLAWGGRVWHWSGNLFRHRLLCAARERRDVAGGRRAVEDDCYLERSIRVVWAHHSGHVYLPAWTGQPRGGGEERWLTYLFIFERGAVIVKMKE